MDVEHVRPGERNPIEGAFGQAKTAYGLNRVKARLAGTSESWIATIILTLNLIKLIGLGAYCQLLSMVTFSAEQLSELFQDFMDRPILLPNFEQKYA